MKITENAVVALAVKFMMLYKEELLEDTEEIGPFEYIQGTGAYVPTIEMALDGKQKGYKNIYYS